jgi:hypothetical protein
VSHKRFQRATCGYHRRMPHPQERGAERSDEDQIEALDATIGTGS